MAINALQLGNMKQLDLGRVMGTGEQIKGQRIRNTLMGYQAEEAKNVIERRRKAQEIQDLYKQMPARIAKYRELGMHEEANQTAQAYISGKEMEIQMLEIATQTLTPENWKPYRQELLEAGAIDGSMMPVDYDAAWLKKRLEKAKGDLKKFSLTYGAEDGRTMSRDILTQDGDVVAELPEYETTDSKKARGAYKGTRSERGGDEFSFKSADHNAIYRAAADQFDTILGPNGEFMGLYGDDKRAALQLAERASQIYQDAAGTITHAQAVAEAARDQGLTVRKTGPDDPTDPLRLRE